MKKIIFISFALLCLLNISVLSAQTMLREAPLETQIKNSSLVIEGKVAGKTSVWSDDGKLIYSINEVVVKKVFRGSPLKRIEVITLGGTVGSTMLNVTPSLKLEKNDTGIFMLVDNNVGVFRSSNKQFKPYGSLQGFYKYNMYDDLAVNPFNMKHGISSSFYSEIMNYTKSQYTDLDTSFDVNKFSKINQSKSSKLPPTGINFSPTTSTAGTGSVLTITGSGFGTTKGQVGFSNANDGGATFAVALETQVLTWSDTQITVQIPSEAGTGPVLVVNSDNTTGQSGSDLTITYAESNAVFDIDDETPNGGSNGPLTPFAYPIRHIDHNGSGGYTFHMFTDFFNDSDFSGSKAAFEKVLDQWRCETKVNWGANNTAISTDVAVLDGVNIVKFDNSSMPSDDLGDDVLGQTFNWVRGCGVSGVPNTWNAYVAEIDVVFDGETDWYFGTGLPALAQFDFESVALHELGHAHQLDHTIDNSPQVDNSNDVMHYAISNSEQQRVLSSNNIVAANNVQARSTGGSVCSRDVMTNSSICNLSVDDIVLSNAIKISPNPTTGVFHINTGSINLEKAVIYDISGRLVSEHDISNTTGEKTINLNGISKGVYFVNLRSKKVSATIKLIYK